MKILSTLFKKRPPGRPVEKLGILVYMWRPFTVLEALFQIQSRKLGPEVFFNNFSVALCFEIIAQTKNKKPVIRGSLGLNLDF